MKEELKETNVWKAVFENRDDPAEQVEIFFEASMEYQDAMDVLKDIGSKYDYEDYHLMNLEYMGILYCYSFPNKKRETEK